MNQNDMVIEYMKMHGSITSKEASDNLGITRLAARISDIKNKGVNVMSAMETGKNRFGAKTSYKRYRLG